MKLVPTLRALGRWAADSDVLFSILASKASKHFPPPPEKMGYERRPHYLLLPNQSYYDLPQHNQPFQARAKIELHEARRAGTHLDFRIVLPSTFWQQERVYDFAVVKRTEFPQETGKPFLVVQRNNHSMGYFNTDSHTFGPGEYGEGEMKTIWRGIIDVTHSSPDKIEFQINDGEFAGRYCIFTSKSEVVRFDTDNQGFLIRMKDPVLPHKERMQFVSGEKKVEAARALPNEHIAEFKADGANFTVIPGPKENLVISRRLSVTGHPINQSSKMPWLKHAKFPEEYYGRFIHCEIVEYDPTQPFVRHGHHTETAGLLNSKAERSRSIQLQRGKPLIAMIWDIDGDQPYEARRADYMRLVHQSAMTRRVDLRRWGAPVTERLLFKRLVRPFMLHRPRDNRELGLTMEEWSNLVKDRGGEGVVIKRLDGRYYEDPYIKDKRVDGYDVTIVDFLEGEGRNVGRLGALVVEDPETKVRSKVGTGFSDQERQDIWDNRDQLAGAVISAEAVELSPRGALRGPRFVELHTDSNAEEL